jgi:hypothetical protein
LWNLIGIKLTSRSAKEKTMSRLDRRSNKEVTQMGPSAQEVQDRMQEVPSGPISTAASYAQKVKARGSAQSVKGKGKPLGGAPPLDPEKMSKLAAKMAPRPQFEEEAPEPSPPEEYRVPQEPPSSLPSGVGAAYQVNQRMAAGELDGPVSMREAKKLDRKDRERQRQLSPETMAGLQRMQADADMQEPPEAPQGPPPDTTKEDLEEATRGALEREVPFDYEAIVAQQQPLMSPDRKKAIEDRLEPLDLADLIVKREITQDVPVIPGKLHYTLRTFAQTENLFCLSYVYEHPGSVTYAEEFLNTLKLVCSLVAINGAVLPDHRSSDGKTVDKDAFDRKMGHVAGFPTQLIADLSVQTIWFNQRVNKLFDVDTLKNG